MKKRGFTLIELLAVIVILAIIALIATPIVMNVIENARKGAAERSAENYIGAIETAVMGKRIEGSIIEGLYVVQRNGDLCPLGNTCDEITNIDVDMSGNKPNAGIIDISNGSVSKDSIMVQGDYTIAYDENKISWVATKNGVNSEDDDLVTVYRWSADQIDLEQEINPNDTTKFAKDSTTLEKGFYLRYGVGENNKVKKIYSCIRRNDAEVCVRGGVDNNGKSYFIENILTLQSLQSIGFTCNFDGNLYKCEYGSKIIKVYSNGLVSSHDSGGRCTVNASVSSICGNF